MKKRLLAVGILFLFIASFITLPAVHAMHGKEKEVKKAILLVAFGTSIPEAQKSFDIIDKRVRQAFPGVEVRWAYTSRIIRKKLARQGKFLDSPEVALAKLMDDGYTHVALLSLHTIPGEEFHELYVNSHLFAEMEGGFKRLLVARPLLSSYEDMERVAKAMIKHIPGERKRGEAVVLMGHGTAHHPSDAIYMAMNYMFREMDPLIFVGTVEGHPTINDIVPRLKKLGIKKAYLMPFMSVAGDHARNDMAGDEPDSWKSILEKAGIKTVPVLKGTAEYPEVVDVWVEHLKRAYSHFK